MYLIAVHGGAGIHSQSEKEVKRALCLACNKASLNEQSALNAIVESISVLENEECLNAAYGSNLTIDGEVECDASIMDDQLSFGGVGAVSGIINPINLAYAVLKHSKVPDPLGRIAPLTLVSHGAASFAAQQKVSACLPESLISPRSRNEWTKWKTKLERSQSSTLSSESIKAMQDTVGAVVLDSEGNLAAGVSSGGLLLKNPGRIGEAALFGAGCWAQSKSQFGIACSVSGTGEQVIRSSLAQSISQELFAAVSQQDEIDIHSIIEHILTTRVNEVCGSTEPQVGVLLLTKQPNDGTAEDSITRLWCAFTTKSMAIAYASSQDPKPKAIVLRRPDKQHSDGSPSICITSLPLTRLNQGQ